MEFTDNDVDFYVEQHGSGLDLVLVGGFGDSTLFWSKLLPELTCKFRVTIFDNQAVGQTKDSGQELDFATVTDNIYNLLEVLHLKKPLLFGSSMGGTIVQHLVVRYPHAFDRICLSNTVMCWSVRMLQVFSTIVELSKIDIAPEMFFSILMPWLRGNNFLQNKANLQRVVSESLHNPHPQSVSDMARQYALLREHDTSKQLHKIITPALVVYATEDITATPAECKDLAAAVKISSLREIPGGHGSPVEEPKRLAAILHDFFTV